MCTVYPLNSHLLLSQLMHLPFYPLVSWSLGPLLIYTPSHISTFCEPSYFISPDCLWIEHIVISPYKLSITTNPAFLLAAISSYSSSSYPLTVGCLVSFAFFSWLHLLFSSYLSFSSWQPFFYLLPQLCPALRAFCSLSLKPAFLWFPAWFPIGPGPSVHC
jgi:hypothetical protein